jgi:hypothetical protein
MLSVFRPYFEVVREGRLSDRIRPLQDQWGVFFCWGMYGTSTES